jgi:lipoprotein-releasing system ATP-binding protein
MSANSTSVEPILSLHSITKEFIQPDGTRQILFSNLSLEISRGEILAIVGASGTGKSTLLHLMGGLDKPTKGIITLHTSMQNATHQSTDYASLNDGEMAELRNRSLGFVFQFHHLLPEFSVLENVLMPALIAGKPLRESTQRATEILESVGLTYRLHAQPATLSGGEQQRTAFARALMMQPALILADEPTGNLDEHNAQEIIALIHTLRAEHQQAFVLVTHSKELAAQADRIVTLHNGTLSLLCS